MKAKESKTPTIELYDPDVEQEIFFTLTKNAQQYEVSHKLAPLTDERFFQREREFAATLKRAEKNPGGNPLASDNLAAVISLWKDLVISRTGYKERPDWKEKTHEFDQREAIAALLKTDVILDDADGLADAVLFDEDELTVIKMNVAQSGTVIGTTHSFREETKAEMDEFTAMLTGASSNGMASHAKSKATDAERLCALYDEMIVESTGYAGRVPAWHKAAAVRAYFEQQLSRLGKSLGA